MKTRSFDIIAASLLALSFLIVTLLPAKAQSASWFRVIKKQNVPSQKMEKAKSMTKDQQLLLKNKKLVINMRAFRKAPPELKELVSKIVTDDELNALTKLDIKKLPNYHTLRSNLNTTGLASIQSGLMRARGTKFKTAQVILLGKLAMDSKVDARTRSDIISTLKKVSLMPYRFGDRHQFVAYVSLKNLMDDAQFKNLSNEFVNAHQDGKNSQVQLAVYRETLKLMKAGGVKAPSIEGIKRENPAFKMLEGWDGFTKQSLAVLLAKQNTESQPQGPGAPMKAYSGDVEIPEMPAEPGSEPQKPTYSEDDEIDPDSPGCLDGCEETEYDPNDPHGAAEPGEPNLDGGPIVDTADPAPPEVPEMVKSEKLGYQGGYLGPDGHWYESYAAYRANESTYEASRRLQQALRILCAVLGGDYCKADYLNLP